MLLVQGDFFPREVIMRRWGTGGRRFSSPPPRLVGIGCLCHRVSRARPHVRRCLSWSLELLRLRSCGAWPRERLIRVETEGWGR